MGQVIKLQTAAKPRLCSACENGYLGPGGVYCVIFSEFIYDEKAAASDCPEWDEA